MIRYCPGRDFPHYAFVPGHSPHPTRDERGHSFGKPEPKVRLADCDDVESHSEYLFGCDLYNHGYFWEAHEAWEALWVAAKHEHEKQLELFLQGLIQLSAARLKLKMGVEVGFLKLADFGTQKLSVVLTNAESGTFMRLDLANFLQQWREYATDYRSARVPLIRLSESS